jgi:hypothetical protein
MSVEFILPLGELLGCEDALHGGDKLLALPALGLSYFHPLFAGRCPTLGEHVLNLLHLLVGQT